MGFSISVVGGCKFSLEEERLVIDLQAQFGNKWARIATYLPGRTDNDKRLARILQASAPPSHTKTKGKALFMMRFSLWRVQSSVVHQRESHHHRLNHAHHHLALGTPRLSKWCTTRSCQAKLLALEANPVQHELAPTEKNPWIEPQPLIPFPQNPQPQTDLEFSLETQELLARFDPYFDMLTPLVASELGNGGEQLLMEPHFSNR
ncbi:myb-like HTH transcriptional regulator family protein [Prunus dulcis]|uniref:Myb-like HTH transcriptional regulator family protein n=1 Tax=Prunus dulcis TaxID=3755 RepID=A0A4Y1QZK6_PRUDU|nr:myb-like HTH transcriptional regulator family protein [Prunus dulcis]